MTKAALLLFNAERLIDLCPLKRVLDYNFTVFIDHVVIVYHYICYSVSNSY